MKDAFRLSVPLLATAFFSLAASLCAKEPKDAQQLAVIVNKNSAVTNLTLEELQSFFTLEKQFWSNGKRVVLLLRHNETMEQKILLEKVYKMSAQELRKYWVAKIFGGQIPAIPSIVRSANSVIALVKRSEGAISVLRMSDVTEDVRVLTINGKSPGEAGYPLSKD